MAWSPKDIPDLTGRTFIVTGANGGLGEISTRELAARGASVVMACRNVEKAQQIADGINGSGAPGDARVARLDLADLRSVREFTSQQDEFDVLINNAGLMNLPMRRTVDGFEMQFGVNHLGHFVLTAQLWSKLRDRVVTLASIAHKQTPKLWVGDLNYESRRYQRNLAYAQSKLSNLMFARELQRRLDESGSTKKSFAVHPGVSGTDLFAGTELSLFDRVGKQGAKLVGHAPKYAAQSTLYAATTPDADPHTYWGPTGIGQMRGPVGASASNKLSQDQGLWERLWDESERMTGVNFVP